MPGRGRGMDYEAIRNLINLIRGTEVVELEVEHGGMRVRIRRGEGPPLTPHPPAAVTTPVAQPGTVSGEEASAAPSPEARGRVTIRSPIVGTFYRAPAPDQPPFVEVGDTVQKGQVLCIVEAMKLMNEIESEVDGRVVEILVENGAPVEYGTPLFYIEPLG